MLAYLGLGSNVGDKASNLQAAVNFLDLRVGHVRRLSTIYETAPMYIEDQASFLNAVAEVETHLAPESLLKIVKEIEKEVGRIGRERYGPREIDIDVLAVVTSDDEPLRIQSPGLQLPHPRIAERRFVLEPLAELAPSLRLSNAQTVSEALASDEIQKQEVRPEQDAVLSVHRD